MNCKCDYCGYHDFKSEAGKKCHKCGQGVMCALGSKGWPGVRITRSIKK